MAGRVVSTQDIDAYNDGVKGNSSKGILSAAERGTSAAQPWGIAKIAKCC